MTSKQVPPGQNSVKLPVVEAGPGAIFAGHIEPQPVIPGVADAHAEDG
jgi:hypothetical protein